MDNDQLYARLDALARGEADNLIAELRSGYAVFGDEQWLPGYCLLIHRDRVRHLDELPLAGRTEFLAEMSLLGEALRAAASAFDAGFGRVNYEILGNSWPQLHAHVFPATAGNPTGTAGCRSGFTRRTIVRPRCRPTGWPHSGRTSPLG